MPEQFLVGQRPRGGPLGRILGISRRQGRSRRNARAGCRARVPRRDRVERSSCAGNLSRRWSTNTTTDRRAAILCLLRDRAAVDAASCLSMASAASRCWRLTFPPANAALLAYLLAGASRSTRAKPRNSYRHNFRETLICRSHRFTNALARMRATVTSSWTAADRLPPHAKSQLRPQTACSKAKLNRTGARLSSRIAWSGVVLEARSSRTGR